MLAISETVQFQHAELCLKMWEATRSAAVNGWHYHKEIEFLLMVEGILEVQLPESKTDLGEGDIMVIGSNQPHTTRRKSADPIRYYVLQLDISAYFELANVRYLHMLKELTAPLDRTNYIFREQPQLRTAAAQTLRSLYAELTVQERGFEMAASILVKQLLLLLIRNDVKNVLGLPVEAATRAIGPALSYIDQHYTRKLTVAEASRAAHMSSSHFMRLFKQTLGMSFTAYVQGKRIKRAEQLLLAEETSIDRIADMSGFCNRAHFYEVFRKVHGCSPRHYRERRRFLANR